MIEENRKISSLGFIAMLTKRVRLSQFEKILIMNREPAEVETGQILVRFFRKGKLILRENFMFYRPIQS